jgi:flavin reductase (DIM6/NTAB) family NADH-FMN oxidoreductase RutF
LSAEPPRLLVSVNQNSGSWEVLEKYPVFGVNILRADHKGIADQFAGRGGQRGLKRYRGAKWTGFTSDGAEILEDALAGIDCIVEEILQVHGGHPIVADAAGAVSTTGNRACSSQPSTSSLLCKKARSSRFTLIRVFRKSSAG